MDTHPKKYKLLLPTHPFPKVELYITIKCKNIYRVTNNDNRKKNHTHTHTRSVPSHCPLQNPRKQSVHSNTNRAWPQCLTSVTNSQFHHIVHSKAPENNLSTIMTHARRLSPSHSCAQQFLSRLGQCSPPHQDGTVSTPSPCKHKYLSNLLTGWQ